ncbi:hypothetical protein DSECCO2_592050 [anaerobic digester metagenome]
MRPVKLTLCTPALMFFTKVTSDSGVPSTGSEMAARLTLLALIRYLSGITVPVASVQVSVMEVLVPVPHVKAVGWLEGSGFRIV